MEDSIHEAMLTVVSDKEVRQSSGAERSAWRKAVLKEFDNLVKNGFRRVTNEEEFKGAVRLPMAGVFVKKTDSKDGQQGTKCKARSVLRGDMLREVEPTSCSTIPTELLRLILAWSGGNNAIVGTADVAGAFLKAPYMGRKAMLTTFPNTFKDMLREEGVDAEGQYEVTTAGYGHPSAPRWWSTKRDSELRTFQFVHDNVTYSTTQSNTDDNVWHVKHEQQVVMIIAVYVDDFLAAALPQHGDLVPTFFSALNELFPLSSAEMIIPSTNINLPSKDLPGKMKTEIVPMMNFCGYELSYQNIEGQAVLKVAMDDYTNNLLSAYGMNKCNGAAMPASGLDDDEESLLPSSEPSTEDVKKAQTIVGELNWLIYRLRPDLSYSLSRAASLTTKAPAACMRRCKRILRYIKATPNLCLYARPFDDNDFKTMANHEVIQDAIARRHLLDPSTTLPGGLTFRAFCDASFAPSGSKSHGGHVIYLGSMPILWMSAKQSLMATSSNEAEVIQLGLAALALLGIIVAMNEVKEGCKAEVFCDNMAAIQQVAGSSSWKSRHVAIRARSLLFHCETGLLRIQHLDGKLQKADVLTKPLSAIAHSKAVSMLRMKQEDVFATFDIQWAQTFGSSPGSKVKFVEETAESAIVDHGVYEDDEDISEEQWEEVVMAQCTMASEEMAMAEVAIDVGEVANRATASLVTSFTEHLLSSMREKMQVPQLSCPPCDAASFPSDPPPTSNGFSVGHIMLAAMTGLIVGMRLQQEQRRVQDIGVQAQDTFDRKQERFKYLGSKAPRTEEGESYVIKSPNIIYKTLCCKRAKRPIIKRDIEKEL